MRKKASYIRRYGEVTGALLYEALQKQAWYSLLASQNPARAAEHRARSEWWGRQAQHWKSVARAVDAEAAAWQAAACREHAAIWPEEEHRPDTSSACRLLLVFDWFRHVRARRDSNPQPSDP